MLPDWLAAELELETTVGSALVEATVGYSTESATSFDLACEYEISEKIGQIRPKVSYPSKQVEVTWATTAMGKTIKTSVGNQGKPLEVASKLAGLNVVASMPLGAPHEASVGVSRSYSW